jgi:type II secretory pathway predicted ATPase ExeA
MNNLILDFYGFSRLPFSKCIAIGDIYLSSSHNEALGMLELGAQTEDILLLTGSIGIGKSVVLRTFIDKLDQNRFAPVYIRGTGLSEGDLYKLILNELNIGAPHFSATAKMLFYKSIPELSKKPVVVIDDAQECRDSALSGIKSMVNFECDSKNRITFILAGQPELVPRIKMAHLVSLRQRINLSLAMAGMSLKEVCEYIDHHTRICKNPKPIFSDEAKSTVFNQSKGIPRLVNIICYNAIVRGAAEKWEIIDASNLVVPELLN